MLLNKSWRQHPMRHQLYSHLPPITKTIQVRQTRHAGHCWRSKDELIRDVLLWTPTYGQAKAGRPAWTYILQLCEDTGCNPEDLPEAMNDREKWRERVRDICAGGTTWWCSDFTCQWCILAGLNQDGWLQQTRHWILALNIWIGHNIYDRQPNSEYIFAYPQMQNMTQSILIGVVSYPLAPLHIYQCLHKLSPLAINAVNHFLHLVIWCLMLKTAIS